jgi:hypothetical protein
MCSLVCAVTLECIIENQYHSYPSMKRFVLALRSFSSFYFHCFSLYICNISVYLFLFFEFARMEHIFSHVYGFNCVRCPTRIGIEHDWRHLFRYQRRSLRYVSILSLAAYFGLELQQFESNNNKVGSQI